MRVQVSVRGRSEARGAMNPPGTRRFRRMRKESAPPSSWRDGRGRREKSGLAKTD